MKKMKSEYEKILAGLTCLSCGGRLEILSPPTLVVRGEEYLTLPGRARCVKCGDEWEFEHSFQCPSCGHWEELPTSRCPFCGSAMEPHFQFEPAPERRERVVTIIEDGSDDLCD